MTLVVNLFAGPGSGKSTLAAHLFALLKYKGVNCELVREHAKELCWAGLLGVEGGPSQEAISEEQYQRQRILKGKVDVIITDSPLLLAGLYGGDRVSLRKRFEEFENFNVFVERCKEYNPKGRQQSEEEAKALDQEILTKIPVPFDLICQGSYGGGHYLLRELNRIYNLFEE